MDERIRRAVGDEPAWVVGGALRDELLGREIVDVDVACPNPELAARLYSRLAGGAVFPLSERHGAWRRVPRRQHVRLHTAARRDHRGGPGDAGLHGQCARAPLGGGPLVDPFGGRLTWPHGGFARSASRSSTTTRCACSGPCAWRTSSASASTSPQRSCCAPRPPASASPPGADSRARAALAGRLPPGRRARPARSPGRLRRGSRAPRSRGHAGLRARRGLRRGPPRFPASNELRKLARTLLAAERPADDSPREIYRFRRRTEPWALSARLPRRDRPLYDTVRAARAADHPEPLLRGEDVLALGIEPGPEVGRLLELVAEERAVGTIATRDEALDLVRAELGAAICAGTRRSFRCRSRG